MVFVIFLPFHRNRRIRRHTNPRNRHIRRQKSPDSSSNRAFQPPTLEIATFVVKNRRIRRQMAFFHLEIATFVVKNRRIRQMVGLRA